eukprot:2516794-Amphidinium_carterae.1
MPFGTLVSIHFMHGDMNRNVVNSRMHRGFILYPDIYSQESLQGARTGLGVGMQPAQSCVSAATTPKTNSCKTIICIILNGTIQSLDPQTSCMSLPSLQAWAICGQAWAYGPWPLLQVAAKPLGRI